MVADIHAILDASFLPSLLKNIDDIHVTHEMFADYRQVQLVNTQILFDAIQQYKNTENTLDSKVSLFELRKN